MHDPSRCAVSDRDAMMFLMRTTLDIADDVLAAARTLAGERGTSIGEAVSTLARQGLVPHRASRADGFPVFEVAADAPLITPEMVREALEE